MKYQEIISKLTLEEKVALTSGKDFWQTVGIDRDGVKVPSIFLSDGPHGIRKQAAAADHLGLNASIPATCFPTAATMANSWNDELGEEMGKMLGEEAVDEKVNVLLGPGTNMKRNPVADVTSNILPKILCLRARWRRHTCAEFSPTVFPPA